jgi:sugar phosphate isomerase/epimerase
MIKLAYAYRSAVFYPHHERSRRLPPPDVRKRYLAKVRSLGFEGIELDIRSIGGIDLTKQAAQELRRELDGEGLPCVALRNWRDTGPGPEGRHNDALLKKAAQVAPWLGSEFVNTTVTRTSDPALAGAGDGSPVMQGSSRQASESDFVNAAARLAIIADIAAESGSKLALELHHHSIMDNSWSLLHMLELVDRPNVGVNPDIKNIYWGYYEPEESCEAAILALAPHTIFCHCKNVTRLPIPTEKRAVYVRDSLGDGEINFRFAIGAMLDAGYIGYLAIEGDINGDQLYIDGKSAARARTIIEELH